MRKQKTRAKKTTASRRKAHNKIAVRTSDAPSAIGPYSQAILFGNLLFLSGQIPLDPATGLLSGETIEDQTARVIENIAAILRAKGLTLSDVVKTTVFLTDLSRFGEFNAVYERFFSPPYPARSTVEVSKIPKGALIEIEAIAISTSP